MPGRAIKLPYGPEVLEQCGWSRRPVCGLRGNFRDHAGVGRSRTVVGDDREPLPLKYRHQPGTFFARPG
ncbi:hypothetical protein SKAU_G00259510 [Synaphobranchus kaupii]|uniref:Uncharacterized protein n=1 Tax=Synaphobranchus kaupii TaxID=118154 RepID=A0A9Q1F4J5_SYNKA|nr:hypothetical protein SKAU_G00259510 [Synaphobranchus kaupii]